MTPPVEPSGTLDHAELRTALEQSNTPCLLAVLFQLTGDERWLRAPYLIARTEAFEDLDDGGLSPERVDEVRAAAFAAISEWHGGKPAAHASPSPDVLVALLSTVMGDEIPADYAGLAARQMGLDPFAAKDLSEQLAARGEEFEVLIVGAGFNGLALAVQLKQAGIPFSIVERNAQVGGAWFENRYPGARCDIPSNLYSYSFFSKNWSENFAQQPEIERYIHEVVEHYGLAEHIRFGVSVENAAWNEDTKTWAVSARTASGVETLRAHAMVTAVGLQNTPHVPAFPGMEDFTGQVVHSARWPADAQIAGKKVAVVGAGASAMQVVCAIAPEVDEMVVLQREPHWIVANPHYFEPDPEVRHWLFDHVPYYRGWFRFRLYWLYTERTFTALEVDPRAAEKGLLVSERNDGYRAGFLEYIASELAGRDELIAAVTPAYPPFGKRILFDNGWYKTLRRENVTMVTGGIERFTPRGVVTNDGVEHVVDTVVLCTGFEQQRYLHPMELTGRGGVELRDAWSGDDARAYLGLTAPDFPNLFFLYGPNSNPPGGSVLTMTEAQIPYVVGMLSTIVSENLDSVECKAAPFEQYNQDLDAANDKMVYAINGVRNYYRNARGRVVTNSPWRVADYFDRAAAPDLADFEVNARP